MMGFLWKLVRRDFTRHSSMLSFALMAIAAVSCLIVWFVAGIDVASLAEDNGTRDFFGEYTLALCADEKLEATVTDCVEAMPKVSRLCYAWQRHCNMFLDNYEGARTPTGTGDRRSPMLMGIGDKQSPFQLEDGRWFANPMECVVSTAASDILTAIPGGHATRSVKVGDTVTVKSVDGEHKLKVVGIVNQKTPRSSTRIQQGGKTFAFGFGIGIGRSVMGASRKSARKPAPPSKTKAPSGSSGKRSSSSGGKFGRSVVSPVTPSVYVSMPDVVEVSRNEKSVNIMFVQLAKGYGEKQFYADLEKACGGALTGHGIRTVDTRPPEAVADSPEQLSDTAIVSQAWSTIGIVIVASVFIIFTTLSIGVNEKVRYLAMLRTVGFTRFQVALFILMEGACLGLLGWLAGMLAGWCLLTLLIYMKTDVFPIVTLSWPCVLFAFACSMAGALIASIVPAWRATRVSPAESMVRKSHRPGVRALVFGGVAGLLLLALIPVMVFWLPMGKQAKLLLFSTAGTFCLGAGFLLFFPWTIVFTEKMLGPLVARLFAFNPKFLAQILTGNQWRTLGTAIALSIGLGLFTAIHIWAASMLNMFTVPDTIPDVLVRFQQSVISDITADGTRSMPGIRANHFMRVSVAQPDLTPSMQQKMREGGAMKGNVVVMGVDAAAAWRDKDPMLRLRFIEGSRKDAFTEFSKPGARCCVIPETLAERGDLHLGDILQLAKSDVRKTGSRGVPPPPQQEATGDVEYADYRVVGVVDFAWVWMSKCAGVRVSTGRTAGLIFTPYNPPMADFGAPDNEFFWFDTDPGVTYAMIDDYMKALAARAVDANPEAVKARSYAGGTRWDSGINRNHVLVSSNESLNNSLNSRAYSVIGTMTQMPMIILLLATIAVLNTMVVSVRSRRWEMGILRACGVTRWGLVRMILAEALLIGLCACVMSFCFGLFYAWLATAMIEYAPMFGIIAPPLTIPWARLVWGFALAIVVCAAAGAYPAVTAGITETSALFQRRE